MKKQIATGLLLTTFAASAGAQDFGVMQSAEIIKQGNYKLSAYPVFLDDDTRADDDSGFAVRVGYGFTRYMDGELKYASFDDTDYIGADLEFDLSQQSPLDVSLALGGSLGNADRRNSDSRNLDASFSVTGHIAPLLEIGAAMDFSHVQLDDAPLGADDDYNQLHFVPMMEYRLLETVDLIAEYGVAMNDEATDYFAAGVAVYMQ